MSVKTFKGSAPAARISDGVATLEDEDGWASTGRWLGLEQASSRPATVKANTWLTVVIFEIIKRSTLPIFGLPAYGRLVRMSVLSATPVADYLPTPKNQNLPRQMLGSPSQT